ncbi:MAG: hypothetical protein WC551_13220 [Patescibacteria group bacterium]
MKQKLLICDHAKRWDCPEICKASRPHRRDRINGELRCCEPMMCSGDNKEVRQEEEVRCIPVEERNP